MVGDLPGGMGGAVIDFLGHMRPDGRLERSVFGRRFIGPVGLGTGLDGSGVAMTAWERFGFSFLELGPVSDRGRADGKVRREDVQQALVLDDGAMIEARDLAERLKRRQSSAVHRIIRLRVERPATVPATVEALLRLAQPLATSAHIFSVSLGGADGMPAWSSDDWKAFWGSLKEGEPSATWLLVVPVNGLGRFSNHLWDGCAGVILDAHRSEGGSTVYGPASLPSLVAAVRQVRTECGPAMPIIASGGIHQPVDAAEVLQAGATLVQIDTGMIYTGPGLSKRINEAVLSTLPRPEPEAPVRWVSHSWFWTGLMGLGMLFGSVLALWIALTRVVMPYDEAFCGISRAQLEQINGRILPFMSHDRVALAGTMIAIGLLYVSFSWFGSRRAEHWAKVAVLVSAAAGFLSFFLFLGFGYFDPFHGFVTAVLFQLFVQGMVGDVSAKPSALAVDWTESREWRRAQWGQLLLVLHSVGLLGAGVVICIVGIGDVFVASDLNFLQTSLQELREANPRLIPLVAHDRATLGGMLIASGLVYLLGSLWGLRRGARWLWHAFLWSALAAYACAIGVHFWVGYVDWHHLFPAFAGLGLMLTGLGLCRGWLRIQA